jgi:hypothetical protein
MLWVLPALAWLARPRRAPIWKLGAGLLILVSIAVQLLGILVPVSRYYTFLAQASILPWQEALWAWTWSPIPRHLTLLDLSNLDITWLTYADTGWPVLVLAFALVALGTLWTRPAFWRFASWCHVRSNGMIFASILIIALGLGLHSLRDDARYTGHRVDVMQLLAALEAEVNPTDVIFLDNKDYQLAFLNYFKSPALFITLPNAPGERHNPDMIPAVVSDKTADLLAKQTVFVLDWAARHFDRLWLVTGYGPFVTFALRPTEHYLVENHFPIQRLEHGQFARAIAFATYPAPQGAPSTPSGQHFAEKLELVGYDLPQGTRFRPGAVLPLSLVWSPLTPIDMDYNVSVRLVDENGNLPAQRDGPFQDTFGFTSRWEPGRQYRDNHGLQLPANLPPGRYTLQVAVYAWQTGERLPVFSSDGAPLGDSVSLALITIE